MKNILQLLKKQPKKIKKNSLFIELVNIYNSSNELKSLKISNYCFYLLNKGSILPESLNPFYKRFNIPKNMFFPLFLKLKREYLTKRNLSKKERNKYIYERMIKLPVETKNIIKLLHHIEKSINNLKRTPLWNNNIYPKTKKKVDEYLKYNNIKWAILFNKFLEQLSEKYNYKINDTLKTKIDLFIIEIYDNQYNEEFIIKQFRMLSKKYHPDHGGCCEDFNILRETKDKLLQKKVLLK